MKSLPQCLWAKSLSAMYAHVLKKHHTTYVSCACMLCAGSLLKELHPPPTSPQNVTVDLNLPICHDFGRTGKFTGQWVDHPDRNFRQVLNFPVPLYNTACVPWVLI